MFFRLPPVRSPVPFHKASASSTRQQFQRASGRDIFLYGSGTQALAAALAAARAAHASQRAARVTPLAGRAETASADFGQTIRPEAIIPAYTCPDLIAACVCAGVHARVVDLPADGSWGYDEAAVRAALGPNTVALVCMNFLGTEPDAQMLAHLAAANGTALIQDSAQHFPANAVLQWAADYVVVSFGRGKPLNLLSGGALLVRPGHAETLRTLADVARNAVDGMFIPGRALGFVFNVVTHPRAYWLTSKLPGLRLGETRYKPLDAIHSLPDEAWARIGPMIERYRHDRVGALQWWSEVVPAWSALGIRPVDPPVQTSRRLRLPLLAADEAQRDRLVDELERRGLGASRMYVVPLDGIANVPDDIRRQGPFPNAKRFAGRLFTLPAHSSVTPRTVELTDRCIRELAATGA